MLHFGKDILKVTVVVVVVGWRSSRTGIRDTNAPGVTLRKARFSFQIRLKCWEGTRRLGRSYLGEGRFGNLRLHLRFADITVKLELPGIGCLASVLKLWACGVILQQTTGGGAHTPQLVWQDP
jgi:hypothetical protein